MALKFDRLFVTITDNCGYSCKHCYMNSSPKANRFMDDDIFKRSINLYAENSTEKKVLKVSGGDPLNHPKFKKFVSYATEIIPDVELGILTTDNHFKKNPAKFEDMVKFLQDHNLKYLSFNTDTNYRVGSIEEVEEAASLCRKLSENGNHFFTVTDYPVTIPHYIGNAQKRIQLDECNKDKKSDCKSFDVQKVNGDSIFQMNVTIEGDLQYCLFEIGKYAHVSQDINKITDLLLNNEIFQELQLPNGIEKILGIDEKIANRYEKLPPKCSRLQAILKDQELINKIKKEIKIIS